MPIPACLFAHAYRCRRFHGEAAFGKDTLLRQTFYSFRVHLRVAWPGVITRLGVAPANVHELSLIPELVELTSGIVVGDRNYHSPKTKEELASMAVELLAPYSSKKRDPSPNRSAFLSRFSLPDRHCLFAAHRTLLRKAGVGARPLAFAK